VLGLGRGRRADGGLRCGMGASAARNRHCGASTSWGDSRCAPAMRPIALVQRDVLQQDQLVEAGVCNRVAEAGAGGDGRRGRQAVAGARDVYARRSDRRKLRRHARREQEQWPQPLLSASFVVEHVSRAGALTAAGLLHDTAYS